MGVLPVGSDFGPLGLARKTDNAKTKRTSERSWVADLIEKLFGPKTNKRLV